MATKDTIKAIKRVSRLATLEMDLRSRVARTGRPDARKVRREWKQNQNTNWE